MTVIHSDCLKGIRQYLADGSIDAIVTDPPYELGFMGKHWDSTGIAYSVDLWREALRVLKPGGHLLAFSGSRTYHRMACAIEDAGFEIRDQIMWVYGSGFPKSLDVSKAIDKAAGAEREKILVPSKPGNVATRGQGPIDMQSGFTDISEPVTDAGRQWQGWGTALKPAHEPIVVARKPLVGTVAANVLQHGTGALNIEGCRVAGVVTSNPQSRGAGNISTNGHKGQDATGTPRVSDVGRWPANLIHDGSDEVLAGFPIQYGDSGGAARFFYTAKASKTDRGEGNSHPTVKPTDLMRYLCRLVTPPGGVVLDPFTGSGSTGRAARLEGFQFIGFENKEEYVEIARRRIAA